MGECPDNQDDEKKEVNVEYENECVIHRDFTDTKTKIIGVTLIW